MPSVPGPEGFPEDRGVLRSLLSALAFDNLSRGGGPNGTSRRGSLTKRPLSIRKKRRARRRDCLGRYTHEDDTVDENESTTDHPYTDALDQHQFIVVDPSFVDIFYDAKDREAVEALLDEDLIPIGLEPDDSVMLESFEACIRGDGIDSFRSHVHDDDSSTIRHYQVPLECEEVDSVAQSCSTLSASDAPAKETRSKMEEAEELPVRFLRAGKGHEAEGLRRYQETLTWRRENGIDNLLYEAWPEFELVKRHYPHFFHCKGRNGQPVFFEQPPKTDLRALRNGGVGLDALLKHYAMITEFQWQMVSRDDFQRSIYIIDLAGIRMTDFVGECVDFVRQASAFTAAHYPERAGHVFVVNVPGWFKMIWNVVKPMVDEVTLEKIHILRGKEEIFEALVKQIAVENIPQEYGGESTCKLGEAPEEVLLLDLMRHNNEMASGKSCPYTKAGEPCRFCNFTYARNY